MSAPLSGIIPPMATPLLEGDRLDYAGCDRLLEHMLCAGIAGVFVLGTTGEAPGLSYRLRGELIDHVCSTARGRVPVLVGATDTCAAETIALAERAAKAGACAIVLAPPFYFGLTQPELLGYIERIVPALPLPVFLYNIPSLTRTRIEPETARAAAGIQQILGLKDSSGDLDYFQRVIEAVSHRPDFAVFCGPEELLAEAMRLGARGGVTGGANLFPQLYVDMYNACIQQNEERIKRLQQIIDRVSRSVYQKTDEPSSYLRGVKCALSALGICRNVLAEPYRPFDGREAEDIRADVRELQGATVAEAAQFISMYGGLP
jgi:dihydrodipicolinate synthase/N-acetylneuraminate lyase